jgi:hypothetical protein
MGSEQSIVLANNFIQKKQTVHQIKNTLSYAKKYVARKYNIWSDYWPTLRKNAPIAYLFNKLELEEDNICATSAAICRWSLNLENVWESSIK